MRAAREAEGVRCFGVGLRSGGWGEIGLLSEPKKSVNKRWRVRGGHSGLSGSGRAGEGDEGADSIRNCAGIGGGEVAERGEIVGGEADIER